MNKLKFTFLVLYFACSSGFSQNNEISELDTVNNFSSEPILVDGIFAVVGDNVIFHSDINSLIEQYESQYQMQGVKYSDFEIREQVVEELLLQKILLHFAALDSIEVDNNEIENELNQRMLYFEQQLGSKEKVLEYFQKPSITDLSAEFRPLIRDQKIIQKMRYEITKNTTVSPLEVSKFYSKLDVDDIPVISEQFKIAQIIKIPDAAVLSVEETLSKLEDLRNRILNGADFATMAILYSEDPGTNRNGGALYEIRKGMGLAKQFEAVAFSLSPGDVSEIFETEFGYHIIELIERRGNEVDLRHILMTPKISNKDMLQAQSFLKSLKSDIIAQEMTFFEAAQEFSSDSETRYNGGVLINPNTNNSLFSSSEIDPVLLNEINLLEVGQMTDPVYIKLPNGKEAYRIVKLVAKYPEHVANLSDDYAFLNNYFNNIKQQEEINDWYRHKIKDVYIYSTDNLYSYSFYNNLVNNE